MVGAAGHPGSCRGCHFDEHCLGQGSSRRECKQWFWSVVRRSGQQDYSGRFRPMFAVKKDNKDPPL